MEGDEREEQGRGGARAKQHWAIDRLRAMMTAAAAATATAIATTVVVVVVVVVIVIAAEHFAPHADS